MPKAFNESERERIRSRLIEAGKRTLNRGGMKGVVIDDIARGAGISKGSFYSFFPSREDFILSVFEAWESEYREALIRTVTESAGSPREKMERFFKGAFALIEREPGLSRIGLKDVERLVEALPPERLAAHQANDNKVLETTFAEWFSRGLLDPAAAEAMHGLVAALFLIAMHKEDFPAGTYEPTINLVAEALAMRIASGGEKGDTNR